MDIVTSYSLAHIHSLESYCRQSINPDATGLAGLQWDSAKLHQVGVKDHMSYDDAFVIEEVCSSL